jgi:hypothetical protein
MADSTAYEYQTVDRLIAVLNNGDDGAAITDDYRTLVKKLGDPAFGEKRKGKLTIEIEFTADARAVDVVITSKVKEPQRPKIKDRLFHSSRGDTLTARDPGRDTMFAGQDLGRAGMRAV